MHKSIENFGAVTPTVAIKWVSKFGCTSGLAAHITNDVLTVRNHVCHSLAIQYHDWDILNPPWGHALFEDDSGI